MDGSLYRAGIMLEKIKTAPKLQKIVMGNSAKKTAYIENTSVYDSINNCFYYWTLQMPGLSYLKFCKIKGVSSIKN